MKVLVVGGGGREHALAWKLAQSADVEEVLCAPGNAGTREVARNLDVGADDVEGLVRAASTEGVGLVVVGPEGPLVAGITDRMRAAGIATFGPTADAAKLEGSKVFSKEFLERHRIPTGAYRRFDRAGAAKSYLETVTTWPVVVKADGLAGGKGVFVVDDVREACSVVDQIMEERTLGKAGNEIVVEEFLVGRELSVHAVTDGETLLILEPFMDHKQVGEGDTGRNTGGMGVYSPVSFVNQRLMRQIESRILIPTLHGLKLEGLEFRGVLFVGLMVTEAGPLVLEYNVRFGDPETQGIVRRFESDLFPYLYATAMGELESLDPPRWRSETCVGVVACAEGYPGDYAKGTVIRGLDDANASEEVVVFQGGTRAEGTRVLTNGGRVACITGLGKGLEEARERAYAGYERVQWAGKFCRTDIGRPRPKRASSEPSSLTP
ncbi:MAG: phosphoribosylamine--glycine ligase [Planctomycetota bacterium]